MRLQPHKPSPLGFLLADIARQMRKLFDQRISPYGLTQVQWRAILVLSKFPGATQKTIAEQLEIKPITLALLMDRMERGGWVERCRDPSDRRAVKLFLTEKSSPILSIAAEYFDEINTLACQGMGEEQVAHLIALLEQLKGNLVIDSVANTSPLSRKV